MIDVLKADVEGAEWPFIVDLIESGAFRQVKQLLLEPHTPRLATEHGMTLIDYAEAYDDFSALHRVGFRRFLFHHTNMCCEIFNTLVSSEFAGDRLCCYEQFFVNVNV